MTANSIVTTIQKIAAGLGVDPNLALATAIEESNLNPQAVGDGGTSFGLYQLHQGGELGNLSQQQAFNPATNATVALTEMAGVAKANPNASPGQIAALSQRPANQVAYAASVNSIYQQLQAGTLDPNAVANGSQTPGSTPATLTASQDQSNTAAAQGDNTGCAIGGGGISLPLVGNVATAPCLLGWSAIYKMQGVAEMGVGGIIMLAGITILVARGLIGKGAGKTITAAAGAIPGVGTVVGVAGSISSSGSKAPSRTRSAPGPRTSGFRRNADDRLADRTLDAQAQGQRNAAEAGPFDDR